MRGDSLKGRPGMSEVIIDFEMRFRLPFRRLASRGGEAREENRSDPHPLFIILNKLRAKCFKQLSNKTLLNVKRAEI